jgi:hypothetical protein
MLANRQGKSAIAHTRRTGTISIALERRCGEKVEGGHIYGVEYLPDQEECVEDTLKVVIGANFRVYSKCISSIIVLWGNYQGFAVNRMQK